MCVESSLALLTAQPSLASPGVAKRTRSRDQSAKGIVAPVTPPFTDTKPRPDALDTHKGGCRCTIM